MFCLTTTCLETTGRHSNNTLHSLLGPYFGVVCLGCEGGEVTRHTGSLPGNWAFLNLRFTALKWVSKMWVWICLSNSARGCTARLGICFRQIPPNNAEVLPMSASRCVFLKVTTDSGSKAATLKQGIRATRASDSTSYSLLFPAGTRWSASDSSLAAIAKLNHAPDLEARNSLPDCVGRWRSTTGPTAFASTIRSLISSGSHVVRIWRPGWCSLVNARLP